MESKICMECAIAKQDLGEDSCEFSMWYCEHQDQCTQSHTGSSGSMECSIAKNIWDRSKDSGIHYRFMISDGDSKAYGSIWDTYDFVRTVRNMKIWTSGQKNTKSGSSRKIISNGKNNIIMRPAVPRCSS